jgi:hypothetical protein
MEIEAEHRFDDAEMSGRADRKKFGEAFDNPEKKREKKIVHVC